MAATRAGFKRLEQELVASLVGEKVANVLDAIGTKAQYVIDIVVRNLYERTADVGFLARDRELCAFVAAGEDAGLVSWSASAPACRPTAASIRSMTTSCCSIPRAMCWRIWTTAGRSSAARMPCWRRRWPATASSRPFAPATCGPARPRR